MSLGSGSGMYGGQAAGGTGPHMAETERRSQMTEVVCSLEGSIQALALNIDCLEKRLNPVLLPDSPMVEGPSTAKARIETYVPLVQHLAELNGRVQVLVMRTNSIGERIEV